MAPHTSVPPAGRVLTGTCSWTQPGVPQLGTGRDAAARLRTYASLFPVVEADTTYYALPSPERSARWAAATPDGFLFDMKAFAPLTGHTVRAGALPPDLRPPGARADTRLRADAVPPDVRDEIWRLFHAGLEPLAEAGRLGFVLFQYPPWFRPGSRSAACIDDCVRRSRAPVAVEFRSPEWLGPEHRDRTLAFLRSRKIPLVAVDTAQGLPASVPPLTAVTSPDLAVVRFHGRSPAWGTGSKEDAYRHRYTADELRPWVPRLRALAREADTVHALFNNCCRDAAFDAARTMERLLEEPHEEV